MTHDQIREMVRRVNPIPDPTMLEIVDVPVLTTPLERRTEMQIDDRPGTEVQADRNRRRGPLVGIAAAAVILIAGLVFFLTRDTTPVAEPAPNATQISADPDIDAPLTPGAYFVDTDGDETSSLRGTFVIKDSGWASVPSGAIKAGGDDGPYIALVVADVDQVWESVCNAGRTPQGAATTAEDLANQFVATGLTITGAFAPVSAFGHAGYHLSAEVPTDCHSNEAREVWAGPLVGGRYYQDEGQVVEYWFLDVEGTPVMIEASWFPDSSEEEVAELEAVLDTLVITP